MIAPRRPPMITVASVFNMLFGAIALLCCVPCFGIAAWVISVAMAAPAVPGQPAPREIFDILAKHMPGYQEILIVSVVLLFFEALLFIVSGVGTFMLKQWGRVLTILTGLLLLLHSLALLGYYVGVVMPRQGRMEQDMLAFQKRIEEESRKQSAKKPGAAPPPPMFGNPQAGSSAANNIFNIFLLLALAAYGGANIGLMLWPSIGTAFSARPDDENPADDAFSERRRRLLDDDDFDRSPPRDDDARR